MGDAQIEHYPVGARVATFHHKEQRGAPQLKPRWGTPIHENLSPALTTRPHLRLLLPKVPTSRMTSRADVVFVFAYGAKSTPKTAWGACPGVAFPTLTQLFVRRIA